MRGRYVSPDVAEAERYFLVHVMRWKFERSFNVAPTQQVPVVRIADGEREGVTLRWGLVPFNATIEKLSDGPCWRGPWKRGAQRAPAAYSDRYRRHAISACQEISGSSSEGIVVSANSMLEARWLAYFAASNK